MPRKKQLPPTVDEPGSEGWNLFMQFRADVEMYAENLGKIKGAINAYRHVILLFGEHLFGTKASKEMRTRIEAVTNLLLVECLVKRLLEVKSWEELMDWPGLPDHCKPDYVPRHQYRTEK